MRNEDRLLSFLHLKGLAYPLAKISKLSSQGFSSEVYSLDSGKEHYILKFYRDRSGKTATKEMRIYKSLSDFGVPVPNVYLVDVKGGVLGIPFLMMQKLEGEDFDLLIKKGEGKNFVEALALSLHKLHSIDIGSLGLDMPKRGFKDEVSDVRIMAGVLLAFSMAPVTFYRTYKALSEISQTSIQDDSLALLHGDCGPGNVVYSNGTVYLIDLESAYIGNPASDLGYVYHSIKFGAHSRPGLAEDFIDAYENLHGTVKDLEFYKRLMALKLAVLFRFLMGFNTLSFLLLGFKRTLSLLAMRKHLSAFVNYCLTYAEKGKYS